MKTKEIQIQFLEDFYRSKKYQNDVEVDFFTETSLVPPRFDEIYQKFKPAEGNVKIILIDGHPRTGKTWLALNLISRYILESNSKNKIWHSGVDSCKIFENCSETIFDGFKQIEKEFVKPENRNKKVFFLDDFLGTYYFRPLGVSLRLRTRLKKYLNYTKNPIIDNLPLGSTLIITSRSLYIYILYRTVGVNIPNNEINVSENRSFIPIKWGVFQTMDTAEVTGSFDLSTLDNIWGKIENYIQKTKSVLRDFALHAPIIRFSKNFPEKNEKLDNEISRVFFGEDIDTLKNHIIKLKKIGDDYPLFFYNKTNKDLYDHLIKLYFLIISPSLFFYNEKLFESLKIQKSEILSFSQSLYYSANEVSSSRFPSIFYFIAVSEHLNKHLDFALLIVEELFSNDEYPISTIFRGFAERALSEKTDWKIHDDLEVKIMNSKLKEEFKQALRKDNILRMEFHKKPEIDIKFPEIPKPIFFSYSSWCMNRLLINDEHYPEISMNYRKKFIEYFILYLLQKHENKQKTSNLLAGFSTFLQWTLKNNQINPKIIETEGKSFYSKLIPTEYLPEITTVFEDELLWALFEKMNTSNQRTPPDKLLEIDFIKNTFLKSFEESNFKKIDAINLNRYFSLIWHNEWMMPSTDKISIYYSPILANWCKAFRNFLYKDKVQAEHLIVLLNSNFIYHWYHFITQRTIWLRDWCLSSNPLEYEKNLETTQISMGSQNCKDHEMLLELIIYLTSNIAMDSNYNKSLLKTTFFFISLRTSLIEKEPNMQKHLDDYRKLLKERMIGHDNLKSILIASFELSRHGFLQPWSKIVSEKQRELIKYAINFDHSCLETAWIEYLEDIELCLDEFDFIPKKKDGWKNIFPNNFFK
ncbi:MAG: hypothetical protein WC139_05365 [Candidatus Kapaibacterium sp.]